MTRIITVFPKDSEALFNPSSKRTFGGATVQMHLLTEELSRNKNLQVFPLLCEYENIIIKNKKIVPLLCYSESDNIIRKIRKLHRSISQTKPDIIIQHGLTAESCLLALYCRLRGIAFIFMFAHDVESARRYQSSGKKCLLFPLLIRFSYILVVQNTDQQKKLEGDYPKQKNKYLLLYNGFPEKKAPRNNSTKRNYILWVARSDNWKNPELFIALARKNPELRFIMICPNAGNNDYYRSIQALAAECDNLEFIPFVPFDMIDRYFTEALVFVNTSAHEGYPQTFIQAAMNAVPVYSLHVDPDRVIQTQGFGRVFDGDAERMCDEIAHLKNSSSDYRKMCENAYRFFIEYHSIRKNVKKLLERYAEIRGK